MKRALLAICLMSTVVSLSGCYQTDVQSFVGGAMKGIDRDNIRRQQEDLMFEARARETIRQGHNDFMAEDRMFEMRRMNMMMMNPYQPLGLD